MRVSHSRQRSWRRMRVWMSNAETMAVLAPSTTIRTTLHQIALTSLRCTASKKYLFQRFTSTARSTLAIRHTRKAEARKVATLRVEPDQNFDVRRMKNTMRLGSLDRGGVAWFMVSFSRSSYGGRRQHASDIVV